MSQTRLPNLLIAGVVKGGTTSLFSHLSHHPDICGSSIKETCYFSAFRYGQLDSRYIQSTDPFKQYQEYFSHCKNQKYIMEATPGYFEGGLTVTNEIKKQLGEDVKVIIILREPIDRLISFFKFKKSMLEIDKSLSLGEYLHHCESIPLKERSKQSNNIFWGINGGFYANHLEDWINTFGDSLKIVFFDHLKSDPYSLLQDICNWLEIDASIYDSYEFSIENKTINYKNKKLQEIALDINAFLEKFWRANPKVKRSLRAFYYMLNSNLAEEDINDNSIGYLKSLYSPYNEKLSLQLFKSGHTDKPKWLKNL